MTLVDAPSQYRRVRSFVRREGRITAAQKDALERLWPTYGLDPPKAMLDLAKVFGRVAPTVVEIGFGNGDHLVARAQAEPEKNFLGIEVHRPGVGRVLHRAEQQLLANLRVACHDAVEFLRDGIAPQSLAEVVVYFPDPWPKKRHHKRRLIQPEFVAMVASRLATGGWFRLATDWAQYGEQMLAVLNADPQLRNGAAGGGFSERPLTRATTRFEARGERLGHQVFDLEFQRQ